MPGPVGVNGAESAEADVGDSSVRGRLDDVKTTVAQLASFGPYRRNSTVPAPGPETTGCTSPLIVALSVSALVGDEPGTRSSSSSGPWAIVVCVVPMPPAVWPKFGLPAV